jgi:hypothetical protein
MTERVRTPTEDQTLGNVTGDENRIRTERRVGRRYVPPIPYGFADIGDLPYLPRRRQDRQARESAPDSNQTTQ